MLITRFLNFPFRNSSSAQFPDGKVSSSGTHCERCFPSAHGCFFEAGLTFWELLSIGPRAHSYHCGHGSIRSDGTLKCTVRTLNHGSPQTVFSDLGYYL